ncbi:8224_t:CDS:2, partial [Acaulospora morrowiae]
KVETQSQEFGKFAEIKNTIKPPEEDEEDLEEKEYISRPIKIKTSAEKFSHVIVKDPPFYNKKNRKEPYRISNFMEYADITKEQNIEIDINYYLEVTMTICVWFINEDEKYQPLSSHKIMQLKNSDKKEKHIDTYSQRQAKKWLTKYVKALN